MDNIQLFANFLDQLFFEWIMIYNYIFCQLDIVQLLE